MPGRPTRQSLFIALLALALVAMIQPAYASSAVHGSVYQWSTFDTLNNVEVTVNSVPQQVMVSKNGTYAFNLDKGSYAIIARWNGSGPDSLFARENVTITQDGGDYVIDLILFPSSDFSDLDFFADNESPIVTSEPPDIPTAEPPGNSIAIILLGIAAVVLLAGAAAFILLRKKKTPPAAIEPEPMVPEPEEPPMPPLSPMASTDVTLPDDLREVIRIIEKSGGRITQLDLRKALPYSEAKVSLMITDLESRGLVKKIKKGRGNVIILIRPDVPDSK